MQQARTDLPEDGRHRILVMDDEESVLKIIQLILEKFNYQVFLARHGQEAVSLYASLSADKIPADIVILDLTVPDGMGGKEAARQIFEMDPNAKIIISSGNTQDPELSDYESWGVTDIISKPFRMENLKKMIARILAQ
jgi:CheY-like chemotaxis protein